MRISKKIVQLLLLFISISTFAGGGWPKKKNTYYLKLASFWLSANSTYSANGARNDRPEFPDQGLFNTNVYGEYGITNKLTAIAYIPFFTRTFKNRTLENGLVTLDGKEQNSFGDVDLGLKYGLLQKGKIAWSVGITLGLPTGNSDSGVDEPLPTGDGEFNQIFRTDFGVSIHNSDFISIYGNAYTGINVRSKGFSEELRGGLELGAGFLDKKLWIISKFDTVQALNNGDRTFQNSGSGSFFANNIEVTNITSEVAYYFSEKVGIMASVALPIAGKFVYADPAYSAGIFLDVK